VKSGWLRRISVGITPESEEAVVELMGRLFGQLPSVCSDVEAGTLRATVYLAPRSAWSRRLHVKLRAGLQQIRECGLDIGAGRISAGRIRREDWSESWKRHFKALDIGSQLLIKPSWSLRRPKPGQKVMVLNPGLSFGTGQHPTTGFCLKQLVAARKQEARQSLLDIGTGTGILAIAGFKLGYRPVEGFDCDPAAVRIARANARRNRADVRFSRQDLARLGSSQLGRYDLVCANLTADLVLMNWRRIIQSLKPFGRIVLAGILRSQFAEVRRTYERAGLKLVARSREEEWESAAFARDRAGSSWRGSCRSWTRRRKKRLEPV